jgi:NADP-reducing hydrogenase subunit HndB
MKGRGAMQRLTVDDLLKIKEENKAELTLREGGYEAKITVHMGTCGIASGARNIMTTVLDATAASCAEGVLIVASGCAGLCSHEPMATIEVVNQPPVKYGDLDAEKIKEIFKEHVLGRRPVEKYALVLGNESTY